MGKLLFEFTASRNGFGWGITILTPLSRVNAYAGDEYDLSTLPAVYMKGGVKRVSGIIGSALENVWEMTRVLESAKVAQNIGGL
jgi:hypothetical protein